MLPNHTAISGLIGWFISAQLLQGTEKRAWFLHLRFWRILLGQGDENQPVKN